MLELPTARSSPNTTCKIKIVKYATFNFFITPCVTELRKKLLKCQVCQQLHVSLSQTIFILDFVHTWGPSVGLTETSIEILITNDLTSKGTLMEVSDGDIEALGLVPGQKIKLKQGIRSLIALEQTERSANASK